VHTAEILGKPFIGVKLGGPTFDNAEIKKGIRLL
jgi:hypothetical protein